MLEIGLHIINDSSHAHIMLCLCQDKRYACVDFRASSEFMIYVFLGSDISAIIHLKKKSNKQILKTSLN